MVVIGVFPALKSSGYAVVLRRQQELVLLEGETIRTIREPGRTLGEDARVRIRQILADVDMLVKRHAEDDPAISIAVEHVNPEPCVELAEARDETEQMTEELFGKRGPERQKVQARIRRAEVKLRRVEQRAYEKAAPLRIVGALQAVADYALDHRIPFVELRRELLRKTLCGKPHASQAAVRRAMNARYGLGHHEHVLDAAAAATAVLLRAGPLEPAAKRIAS